MYHTLPGHHSVFGTGKPFLAYHVTAAQAHGHMQVVRKVSGIDEPPFVSPKIIQQWVTFAIDLATEAIASG